MWKRFVIAGVLIVALSGARDRDGGAEQDHDIAEEVFPKLNQINAPKGVVTPEYSGGPQTFLILGSDRRAGAKDAYDRDNPPHSDTMLLVRFDPDQGQTSVMSIPRDLLVNITTKTGQIYVHGKDQRRLHDRQQARRRPSGGMRAGGGNDRARSLPGLKLNGIVDVSFKGFIKVVDTLGCAYVNVDHHYYNQNVGTTETDYTASTCSPATRSSATKTRSTTCATATPTRTSCASRASRTSCATCASRSRRATRSARSTRSPRPSGTRSARPSTPPRAS